MNTVAYTSSAAQDNKVRMARVLAAGRVKSEREKRDALRAAGVCLIKNCEVCS